MVQAYVLLILAGSLDSPITYPTPLYDFSLHVRQKPERVPLVDVVDVVVHARIPLPAAVVDRWPIATIVRRQIARIDVLVQLPHVHTVEEDLSNFQIRKGTTTTRITKHRSHGQHDGANFRSKYAIRIVLFGSRGKNSRSGFVYQQRDPESDYSQKIMEAKQKP